MVHALRALHLIRLQLNLDRYTATGRTCQYGFSEAASIMAIPAFDYHNLTVSERLRLVGDIWDSIAVEASTSPGALPLSVGLKPELDRRIAEYDTDSSDGVPMDESLARIRAQFRHST